MKLKNHPHSLDKTSVCFPPIDRKNSKIIRLIFSFSPKNHPKTSLINLQATNNQVCVLVKMSKYGHLVSKNS